MPLEARAEIDDAHGTAAQIVQGRLQDRRVAHVSLLARHEIDDVDRPCAVVGVVIDERAEYGVGVEAREAHPHDAPLAIDKRRDLRIADDAQIERPKFACRAHAASATA